MNFIKITLDLDTYIPYQELEQTKSEENLLQLFSTFKNEYLNYKVNNHYMEICKFLQLKVFHVVANVNNKEIIILSADSNYYHLNLIREFTDKFFYYNSLSFTITSSAFDFIRRIPIDEWKKIAFLIENSPSITNDQIEAFTKLDWEHPIFTEAEWTTLALKAYLKGKIDRNQISYLLLYDTYCQNYEGPLNACQILDQKGNIDDKMFSKFIDFYQFYFLAKFTEKQKADLSLKIQSMPIEQTKFLAYKIISIKRDMVIPPINLMNTIYKVLYPDHPMQISPVLGLSLPDDFTRKTKRDAFIPCRYVTNPETIHNTDVKKDPLYIFLHDLEHGHWESANPHRPFWIQLAAELEKENLIKMKDFILDRSFEYHDSSFQGKPNEAIRSAFFDIIEVFGILKTTNEFPNIIALDMVEMDKILTVMFGFIIKRSNFKTDFLKTILEELISTENLKMVLQILLKEDMIDLTIEAVKDFFDNHILTLDIFEKIKKNINETGMPSFI